MTRPASLLVLLGLLLASVSLPACHTAEPVETAEQTPSTPTSLQALIDAAPDGSTVDIAADAYLIDEPLAITERHDLTIRFAPGTTIHLTRKDVAVLRIERSSHVTVDGGAYMHQRPEGEDWMYSHGGVVAIAGSQNVTLQNIDVTGAGNTGVTMSDAFDVTLSQCTIHDNDYVAVFASTSRRLHFEACTYENNGKRYEFYDSHDITEAE